MVLAMQNTFSAILLTALAACGARFEDKPGDGKTFVLVHGAFMNASGWEPVANELRERGATVRVVELGKPMLRRRWTVMSSACARCSGTSRSSSSVTAWAG
jgi:hypothetical protein